MICPKCKAEQPEGNRECMRCGVIFAKLTPDDCIDSPAAGESIPKEIPEADRIDFSGLLKALLFDIESEENRLILGGRAFVYIVFLIWGIRYSATRNMGAVKSGIGGYFRLT